MQIDIDVKRLLCPMPVIRLGETIEEIAVGDTIKITATDPGVLHDIPAWCKVHGHAVLNIVEINSEIILLIKKEKKSLIKTYKF